MIASIRLTFRQPNFLPRRAPRAVLAFGSARIRDAYDDKRRLISGLVLDFCFLTVWVRVGLPVPCPGEKNMRRRGFGVFLGAAAMLIVAAADAAPLRIVAVGASNTSGWLISEQSAYPSILQAMLKEKGVEAQITNAGVPFDTTAKMLARIDSAVPEGTQIVILQPGGNDLRFLGSREQRSANIAMMTRRLQARSIEVIVYDDEIPWKYVFDGIHLTPAGHRMIAASLLPKVMALTHGKPANRSPRPGTRGIGSNQPN